MAEHKFDSIKALADKIGISRTTLYKRAKNNGISLTGSYTDNQIDQLMGVHLTVNSEHIVEQKIKHENEHNSGEFDKAISSLSEQLTAKDEQITELNRRLEHAQTLVDQAQQLQLKTQLQLDDEQKKYEYFLLDLKRKYEQEKTGFWKRLFK